MSYYSCPYCFNKYKLKKNLNSHVALCKEYHRIQTDESPNESLPSPKILYRMLKDLIINQQNLEKEVLFLKNKLNIQQKKDIILWLNETTNRQLTIHENIKMGFSKWSSIFTIQQKHLKSVFEGGITDGIQSVLLDKINSFGEREPKDIPIRAFSQKPGHLYIYDINISTEGVTGTKKDFFGMHLPSRITENKSSSTLISEKPIKCKKNIKQKTKKEEKVNVMSGEITEVNNNFYREQPEVSINPPPQSTENGDYSTVNLRDSPEQSLEKDPFAITCEDKHDESLKNKGNMTAWSWRVAKNEDIERVIENIRRKLLFEFTKWQSENRHLIDSSDEMKENEINYMLTFNCINISLEKRLEIIKKWIYNTIKENNVVGCVEFN